MENAEHPVSFYFQNRMSIKKAAHKTAFSIYQNRINLSARGFG